MHPPIRTITLGIGDPHPLTATAMSRAATLLQRYTELLSGAGFEVQTQRLSARPAFSELTHYHKNEWLDYARALQEICTTHALTYLSLGPVFADDPASPLEHIQLLGDMLAPHPVLNATVQMGSVAHGIRYDAALPIARTMLHLGEATPQGIGNMRFAMVGALMPHGAFFPAAWHNEERWGVTIGLQSADLVRDAIAAARDQSASQGDFFVRVGETISSALLDVCRPIEATLAPHLAADGLEWYGFDLSPATNGEVSIADAIAAAGFGHFGDPATVAVCGSITAAIKATPVRQSGYAGLFFPVLEDAGIARQVRTGAVNLHSLLLYSTVCGTGLDTIPVSLAADPQRMANLLIDTAVLAVRHRKPLTARLMPTPHAVGEDADYGSPWLIRAPVMAV